jgi:hypothetical protein
MQRQAELSYAHARLWTKEPPTSRRSAFLSPLTSTCVVFHTLGSQPPTHTDTISLIAAQVWPNHPIDLLKHSPDRKNFATMPRRSEKCTAKACNYPTEIDTSFCEDRMPTTVPIKCARYKADVSTLRPLLLAHVHRRDIHQV